LLQRSELQNSAVPLDGENGDYVAKQSPVSLLPVAKHGGNNVRKHV